MWSLLPCICTWVRRLPFKPLSPAFISAMNFIANAPISPRRFPILSWASMRSLFAGYRGEIGLKRLLIRGKRCDELSANFGDVLIDRFQVPLERGNGRKDLNSNVGETR